MDRRLRVVADVPLSASRSDRRVMVLQYRETHPEAGPETRTPMDLDHGSAGDPSRGTGDRTDGAQSLEDRKRDLQHAEEPGVRSGTPLRSRSPVPCEYAGDSDDAGVSGGSDPAVVRSPRWCGTRPRFQTTRSWFPPAIVQRALRLLIAGTPPRSVDMGTGHALVRTRRRGPTPPKRGLVTPNKVPKRPQRMENIQGQSLKTCRHCFSTGSGNC